MLIALDWLTFSVTLFLLLIVVFYILTRANYSQPTFKAMDSKPTFSADAPGYAPSRLDILSFVFSQRNGVVDTTETQSRQGMSRRLSGKTDSSATASVGPEGSNTDRIRQAIDAFLVFDVEATCVPGIDFNWCNEIIEWPIVLLRWNDKTSDGKAAQLVRVDEFRTYVRPTLHPMLSDFCKDLTGISQAQVDMAPTFPEMLPLLKAWMVKHDLISPTSECPLQPFAWCTDGPYDIRDFVVKQCFISKVELPKWLSHNVIDVKKAVSSFISAREKPMKLSGRSGRRAHRQPSRFGRQSLNIESQLKVLSLPPFQGRQHSGIDDSRNIARIVTELARLGVCLEPNTVIDPSRRWYWMGAKFGDIRSELL